MSYQVLARKWRPINFSQMVGQSHVVKTLSTALELERIHHAYLFTGTRGVGKTTVARIMARCLNCETGVTNNPCGECATCVEIDEGRFVDLIEVDAASKTKIDDTRELLENVQYRPSRGRYKIYLIDEVHMLSKHSFNALLKTLEEPPPHVIFLLATTDPQMLPATVLSRCLQFHLKNMTTKEISDHMDHILQTESIDFEPQAIQALATSAKGSMRDGLSLLDQAIAYGQGKVIADDVKQMLGTIDHDHIEQLLTLLFNGDMPAIIALLDAMDEYAPNYLEVLDQIILAMHQIALLQEVSNAQVSHFSDQAMRDFATQVDAADVQLYYQIALIAKRDLYLAPSQRIGVEMCLLRMHSFSATDGHSPQATQGGSVAEKKPLSSSHKASQPDSEEITPVQDRIIASESSVSDATKPVASELPKPEPKPSQPVETTSAVSDWSGDAILRPRSPVQENNESELAPAMFASEDADKQALAGNSEPVQATVIAEPEPVITDEKPQPQHLANDPVDVPISEPISEPINTPMNDEKASLDNIQTVVDITPANWYQVVKQLESTGLSEQILLASQVADTANNTLTLNCESRLWEMISAEQINQISVDLHDYFDFEFSVKIEPQHPTSETPGQRIQRLRSEQLEAATQNLQSDPMIVGLQKKFAANLDLESIKPISPIED